VLTSVAPDEVKLKTEGPPEMSGLFFEGIAMYSFRSSATGNPFAWFIFTPLERDLLWIGRRGPKLQDDTIL